MFDIVRLYVFDGVSHTEDDNPQELWDDAFMISEKIKGTSINRCIKLPEGAVYKRNPVYEELFELVCNNAEYALHIECLNTELVKAIREG